MSSLVLQKKIPCHQKENLKKHNKLNGAVRGETEIYNSNKRKPEMRDSAHNSTWWTHEAVVCLEPTGQLTCCPITPGTGFTSQCYCNSAANYFTSQLLSLLTHLYSLKYIDDVAHAAAPFSGSIPVAKKKKISKVLYNSQSMLNQMCIAH